MDIIRGDLDVLTPDNLIDLLERVSSSFVQSPLCLELIEDDLNELFGLVPGYIKSERLYLRSEELKQKDGARSGGRRRLSEAIDTDDGKLATMANLLRIGLEQLNSHKLNVSVPGEAPTEISNGDVLRLTSINNVASPASMCTKDETSCATYLPNSLRCPATQNQFGIAMVGASASVP